jgi:hypothetical protein
MKANHDKMEANKAELMAEMKAQIGSLASEMNANQQKMDAWIGEMTALLGVTHACLEKEEEPAPEETEAVAEPQEVPEGATDEETLRATEDRGGKQHLAVRHHGQLKKRAQDNGGPRQKFAAVRGRFTRPNIPALRKGHWRSYQDSTGKGCQKSWLQWNTG